MRFSSLSLCICISGATLVTALPSSEGATSNSVTSLDKRQAPHPNVVQIQADAQTSSAPLPPVNANVPPFQAVTILDGNLSHTTTEISAKEESGLQERQAEIVFGIVLASATALLFTAAAFIAATKQIKHEHDFNKARKLLTSTQVEEMWKRNPDYNKYPATACYSKGYRLKNPNGFFELAYINVTAAGGHSAEYACMYIEAPNQFYTDGDGGSLNLGVDFDANRCSFDHKTADLTCN
ncbi:hypothetical protein LZ31DRAFT_257164 [Colletotrichum somersetense]|nr:hypothetical protein LZ31DRAFT_257164 [Colletotrichum somersetense]